MKKPKPATKLKAPKKRKPGRPMKYTPKVLRQYAKELIAFMSNPNNLWLKDWAIQKDICPTKIDEFARMSVEFYSAHARAKQMQEANLVRAGLDGDSRDCRRNDFIKFVLENACNWREKVEHSGDIILNLSQRKDAKPND